MCGCGLNIVPVSNSGGYINTIPFQELSSGSTRAKFKWYFCISPSKVNAVFGSIMVKPNEPLRVGSMSDMEKLADYHDQKLDVQNYRQDLWNLLQKIQFTPDELSKSECTTAFTY